MEPNPAIECVDLHDSCFEQIERMGNDLRLTLDWTVMENYNEDHGFEPLIQDFTTILIKGVKNESIVSTQVGAEIAINNSLNNFINHKSTIRNYQIYKDKKSMRLQVEYTLNGQKHVSCWTFDYERCEIGCKSFFKLSDWVNGKLSGHLSEILRD